MNIVIYASNQVLMKSSMKEMQPAIFELFSMKQKEYLLSIIVLQNCAQLCKSFYAVDAVALELPFEQELVDWFQGPRAEGAHRKWSLPLAISSVTG